MILKYKNVFVSRDLGASYCYTAGLYEPNIDEAEIDWDYEVDDEKVEEILNEFVAEDSEILSDMLEQARNEYVHKNFDKLCITYKKKLLEHFREEAEEDAQTNFEW